MLFAINTRSSVGKKNEYLVSKSCLRKLQFGESQVERARGPVPESWPGTGTSTRALCFSSSLGAEGCVERPRAPFNK